MAWAPSYVTVAELKDWLAIVDDDHDARLAVAITTASRSIDEYCNRQFGLVAPAESRYYQAFWDRDAYLYCVRIDDVPAASGITTVRADNANDETYSYVVDSFRLWPFNCEAKSVPYTRLYILSDSVSQPNRRDGGVKVTSQWGWSAVPSAIKEATLIQADIFYKRREQAVGGLDYSATSRYLDRDVQLMVKKYKRVWGVT